VPGGLHATSLTATSIAVAWTASTDNVAVAGYGLYRNGTSAGTASSPTAIFSGLACGTAYTLAVDAYDAAGNRSSKASINASTSACSTTLGSTTLGTSLPPRMPESSGGSLYVSLSGSDTAAGSIASPFRTVSRAFQTASNGTTIYMRGGTYPDYTDVRNRIFSATNPVTLTNYPGETVTVPGKSSCDASSPDFLIAAMYFGGDAGIRIRGLRMVNPCGTGLKIQNSDHFDVDRMFFGHNTSQGLLVSGATISGIAKTWSTDIQVWNSVFTDNGGLYPPGAGDPNKHDHSIYYGASGSYGNGFHNGTEGGVVANNVFYDQDYGVSMRIGDAARGLLIVNNTIYHSYVHDPVAYPYWGNGISLSNYAADQYRSGNIGVYNNIITDSSAGVYGSAATSMPDNTVDYNLTWNISTTQDLDCTPDCNFNPRWGTVTLFSVGTHNMKNVNPLFVNPSGQNFHLQPGSPAFGRANPAYAPAYDADGKSRPAAPALGAFG
jgi:hypothetical protein